MNITRKMLSLCAFLMCITLTSEAQQRSIKDVISIIENSAPQLLDNSQKAFKSKSFSQKKEMVVASSKMESLKSLYANGQQEAFYVYNAQGGGFMIISADERMQPILGYSNCGSLSADSLPANVKAWMEGYVAEANSPIESTHTASASYSRTKSFTAKNTMVEPLITSEWGQEYPYNELCPTLTTGKKSVTGCVATAMAQIMYYYKQPTVGTGSNSYTTKTNKFEMTRDFSANPFNWSLMKDTYSNSESDETVEAIANLMLSCGVSTNMDYDGESGTSTDEMMRALLKYFGYDHDMALMTRNYMSNDDWHNALLEQLDNGCPMPIRATSTTGYGHAFVIDGYKFKEDSEYPYYHINWGWDGIANGDFLMTNMTYGNHTFSQNLQVIINAKPDDGNDEMPCYLQASSLTPSTNLVDVTKNQKLNIRIDTLINQSCQAFTGTIYVCLKDGEGNATDVYSTTVSDLETSYFFKVIELTSTFPTSFKSGDYTLAVYASPEGSSKRYPVNTGNITDTISIIYDKNVYFPTVMTQNIDVTANASNNMTLTAATIMNMDEQRNFKGTLQMAVADYMGDFITTFGNTQDISNALSYLAYYNKDYTFKGTLPSTIQEGAYKLYLGAQQSGYSSWGFVEKYTASGNSITAIGLDASTNFWVKDGKVTLDAPYLTGDVNHDGYINIADLCKLHKLCSDSYSTKDLIFWSADLNVDGSLDENDGKELTTYVMSATDFKDNTEASKPLSAEIIEHCGTAYLILNMDNTASQFNALQFDLDLPDYLAADDDAEITFSSRTTGYTGSISNGRVIMLGTPNTGIAGTEGAIAYIPLKFTSKTITNATITLRNIVMSDVNNCEAVYASDATVDVEESMPSLAGAIAVIDSYPRGDKLGQYHTSAAFDETLQEARTLAANSKANILDVKEAIATITSDNMVINTPEEGMLLRIKDTNGNYMTCRNTNDNRIEFSSTKDDATIFCYYGGDRLVAYQTGYYVSHSSDTDTCPINTTAATTDDASLYYGFMQSSASIGKYLVVFGDGTHYMSAGGNAASFTAPSDITSADYSFTLEEADAVTMTISSEGMSTLYSPIALEIPTGIKAYAGTYNSEDNCIWLTALHDVIPANTGVVIEGEPNTVCSLSAATEASDTTTSCLSGSVPAIANTVGSYTLQSVDGRLGFYRYTGTDLNGFKAYFSASSASPSKGDIKGFAIIKEGDEAEGIHDLTTPTTDVTAYDLSGKVVASPVKGGIYIINGKKFRK